MARGLEFREFGNQGLAFGVLRVSGSDCRLPFSGLMAEGF